MEVQHKLVLQGRSGIAIYALSGVDLALWDLAAKDEGLSLAERLGGRKRDHVSAYASLVRYGSEDLVAEFAGRAAAEGFPEIKLHEITLPEIRRCREVIGPQLSLTVDGNCHWTLDFALEAIPELLHLGVRWLEEPIFPPEDFRTLAGLRRTGMPLAMGENACTAFPFEEMLRLEATDFLQPSVTRVGGVSEFLKIMALNREPRLPLAPHSPYFGPGYLATLQLAASAPESDRFEYLYVQPQDWIFRKMPLPREGNIAIPDGPGLGLDPDPEILERYAIRL